MSNKVFSVWCWATFLSILVTAGIGDNGLLVETALAEVPPQTVYNPKPAENDLILPMPGDAEMVFRRVPVPGKGFWGDQERIIQIGDAAGGIFEGLQRTQISGSFPVGKENVWEIVLAKYELTRGQYTAVMGMDALLAVSGDPEDQKLPTLKGRALRDALMRPLTYVSYGDVLEFIRRYNQWLFDPEYPERIAAMPRVDGAPGFMRLPAEDEWEYCARGGVASTQAGTFDNGLPFPIAEAQEYAWHLGNAKHQLRPVGLRKADVLGFHDLFGNAQEMTSGMFRPEIWQGKPGGVAVRGGSVSTQPMDLRSAQRAELDVYAWNVDKNIIEERRSFNTGLRLAIGSNVVVTSAQRTQIEQEYETYRADLRRTMPVGRTLDNLVAQATVQLGSADTILARLMKDNPALNEPLMAVQATLDKAKERLELAQRESARSLAQDAARNGVNLSVYLSRLERLTATLKTAQELAAVSSRYQEQVAAVEKSMQELEKAMGEQMRGYQEKVGSLGEYEGTYIEYAFEQLGTKEMTKREQVVTELLKLHVQSFAEQRRADVEVWLGEFHKRFDGFSD
ncbi:SUMF1/EgtB/PvdO family nonheme iron enzyme [Desulfopila aestuarii]|uniref:Formylglycine-generating enzyme, required for sulfatase activity, contains SUMF1/FGE domain n=1 Tax=Desulfopila aestuarii DSM 18488 TaxID=1121416 RepID=A0A1M7YFF1_9BACT|nr:SUMF1/EgtB/PvdO family nonheme iron enzyme [Desulfopila aestuarii]SHO51350.1 Formylglycine-generating enzyme, required for sulfatase activity, contains SUMF1/FGE domain [Desulfopila aestuarii DSM 18488]